MNVNELIESGLLELYAMGALEDRADIEMVESHIRDNKAVREEYDKIVLTLRGMLLDGAVKPSDDLYQKIESILSPSSAKTLSTEPEPRGMVPMYWKYAAAALVIISLGFSFLWYKSDQRNEQMVEDLNRATELLEEQNRTLEEQHQENQKLASEIEFYTDPSTVEIRMGGTPDYPDYDAQLYVNKELDKVVINSGKLPETQSEEQYQLWAIVDGTPVDLGVFDASEEPLKMKTTEGNIQAYAVTIEPRGGVESPTLEKMCLLASL